MVITKLLQLRHYNTTWKKYKYPWFHNSYLRKHMTHYYSGDEPLIYYIPCEIVSLSASVNRCWYEVRPI